ncbi:ead/Ea22-like family protein [Enterobacter mori]|uniref:ead/Ea22-like family protein n=1 Tax=Enterobacter mori TaxID=539813 RepID=UPI0022368EDD|nr:ead/Ea22-like family protein [Enterobacter mori]MCW4988370.1 ead/Ea22-like family protein [Enterobacter mori]
MSNIDKRALREAAERAISEEGETWWNEEQLASDYGLALHRSDAKFIAAANPATVLALLDELEAKDNRINRLEAIVAVAEQRNALMREWKRALKVPCDLVDDQVPVVIHGMVIRLDRLKETEEKLEAAEKKTVEMPTFDGYVSHVARELQAAFRIACDNAGINIAAAGKGEAS